MGLFKRLLEKIISIPILLMFERPLSSLDNFPENKLFSENQWISVRSYRNCIIIPCYLEVLAITNNHNFRKIWRIFFNSLHSPSDFPKNELLCRWNSWKTQNLTSRKSRVWSERRASRELWLVCYTRNATFYYTYVPHWMVGQIQKEIKNLRFYHIR